MRTLLLALLLGAALFGGSGATTACGGPIEAVWCCCLTYDGRTCCNEATFGCAYVPGCYCR